VHLENLVFALWTTAALLLSLYASFGHKYGIVMTHGTSMEPSYKNYEFIIYVKKNPEWKLKRFDAVIVSHQGEQLLKRVIALPGEIVEIRDGFFCVNGIKLIDPYASGPIHDSTPRGLTPTVLPKDSYFFIGDNRRDSVLGIFSTDDIIGKVIF